MDSKIEVTRDPMFDSVEQKIWKQSLNLPDATAEELKEVLTTLKSLPFKDEKQRTSLFESVQCLQGYHIVQIFNVGVARLQKSAEESWKCLAKIITLFEICSSFCYNADASKRVPFEHYLRALKFCFSSEPKKHHLSTEIISRLLELVQILQEKKLCTYPFMNVADLAKPDFCLKGVRELFGDFLTILETRPYDESDVVEIIKQAMRFATADAKADHPDLTHLMKHLPELPFQFDQAIPAVFFKNWIDLLQLTKADDAAFVIRVAMEDHLHQPSLAIAAMPPVCYIVNVLQSMKKNGEQVDLSHDESRLKVFFSNIKHLFENDYQTTVPLLKMLSFKPISDTILAEVYKLFLSKENEEPQHVASPVARHKAQTLESIRQLLFVLPEGSLVVKVLKFWNHVYPNNSDYTALKGLLDLFAGLKTKGSNSREDSLEERAERLLEFITNVLSPSKKPSSGHSWAAFLGLLTSIFPTSFDKLPVEVLSFIEKAVQTPPLQTEALQEYQCKTCDFLNWLSQQKCTEKDKENMVAIYMRRVDPISARNLLSVDLIKSLSLCKPLSLNYMDSFIQEMIGFSKHFKPNENDIIRDLVSKVAASSESPVNHQEIFTELSNTMKHLWDENKPPMKSTRVETFELISLLAKGPLSSLKTVRLLQLSRKSSDGLQCCLRYLQLTSSTSAILKERAFEHFELLFAAMFETLNGNKNLCEMFYTHHRDFTALVSNCCLSVDLLNIWSFVVAGLLSLGLFKENVDSQYCMQVLARATGLDCPFKALQLYFQLRSLFSTVIRLLTIRTPKWSIEQKHSQSATPNPVADLVEALSLIVQSDVSPPDTKLLLIDKVYKLVLSNPRIMIGNVLPSALGNIIPSHQSICHEDIVSDHLELQHIVTILDRPGMLVQLAKIESTPSQSLQSVLCSRIPNPLSKDDVVEIYECVASLKDANKEFFFHLLPLLESITKVCSSASDVRYLMMEAEALLRQIRPQLIPLSVLIFSCLVESKVSKVYREPFIKQVALEWESPCDLDMYTYCKIPQLLWKAHQSASSAEGKLEVIDYIHEVIVRSKDLETHVLKEQNSKMNGVHRSVACCDLEWLTLYSSLTCEDVALCFHLSSCYPGVHALRCFSSVSGVQIQDGCLTPILLQQNEASKVSADKCPSRINDGGEDFVEGRATCTLTESLPSLLTPAMVARKMIVQLRRLLGDDIDLRDIAVQLWNDLFTHHFLPCPDVVGKSSKWSSACDDFVNVFLSVLEKAPYLEVVHPWFSSTPGSAPLVPHHVVQYSNVILESCGWNGKNVYKEGHLQIQAEVIETLKILRSVSEVPFVPPLCFRPLQPQLECLLRILQKRWPLEVTANLLGLARIDWKAASAISAIASHWSSREEVEELVVGVLRLFNEGEIPMYLPLQKEFVWDMLEACSRVDMNSSKDLLDRLDCLINFQNPEELDYGFYRLPEWRKMMTAEGFPAHVIDKWCVAFLFTPRENLSSRDIDAVLDLRPSSLQLVASVFQSIKECMFPNDFHVTREKGIKDHLINKRLRLARLLGEFVNILKIRKSKEASNDAAVTKIVEDACEELCKSYLQNNTNKNLYKIHRHKLKDLFTKVFGKHPTFDDERVDLQECGRREAASEVHENESREAVPEAHENESREAVPEAHENESREVVPEAHKNESREAVPEAHENESREAVSEAHENESREAVPEAHENESREAVPEAHESESREAVSEAHENESREAVSEAHESESREAVPEVHENESREAVSEAHENESREAVPEAHESESREAVPEVHENESKEAVHEAHESKSREAVREAHENESREVVPEAHENESSREAGPEVHENESREAVPEAHENESREAVPEVHENESRVAMPNVHEDETKEAVPEAHENESGVAVPEIQKNESRVAVPEAHEKESKEAVPAQRQSSHRQGNSSKVLDRVEVYEPMLVLLRRWLSSITNKPTLASLTLDVVQLLSSEHSTKKGSSLLEELHHKIQPHILHCPANQILVSQLQAVGYNQGDPADNQDLWASPSVELSCYLSKRESPGEKTFEKKLTNVLRSHWMEWKNLLFMLKIPDINVGESKVCTKDLFGSQASLKEMEKQVAAVKERASQVHSEDVDTRVKQLIRQEQRHRSRIKELYKSDKTGLETKDGKMGKKENKFMKFVAVWENQFLENVKLCSERIPGCYAPNGFHSEKPVLCALSVDNRILTVFKEEKPGRREEIENVEVKLFEAGLYVYGLHTSGHDYVTDELWAAFYKMLLEKGLVPSIALSNESPGFDWIKNFVESSKTHPCTWKWELHRGIVPPEEDYFDYLPVHAAVWTFLYGVREYLTLTRENVASFHFSDFKDANVVEKKKQQAKEIAGKLKADRILQRELYSLHGDEEMIETLAGRLASAVNGTVYSIFNGERPTTETVKKLIDMKRLAFIKCKCIKDNPNEKQCDCKFNEALKSAEDYAAVVLRVCSDR